MKMGKMINKKILVEIFQGIISLSTLAFVIAIYFYTLHGMSPISSNGNGANYDENLTHTNQNHRFNMPIEKVIILRMDDVQGYTWDTIVINLTETILRKNMSVTLGVIPNRNVNNDTVIKRYLLNKIKDPRIEIAQHGTTHAENEFLNLSESGTYNLAKLGLGTITDIFGIHPVTFIPPYNEYNKNTTRALSRLGFKIISGIGKEYKYDGNMMYIGYDTQTKYSSQTELIPTNKIIDACNIVLNEKNICVIMIHPQDYVGTDNKSLNETKYTKFVELLDGLKKLHTRFSTFRDIENF